MAEFVLTAEEHETKYLISLSNLYVFEVSCFARDNVDPEDA